MDAAPWPGLTARTAVRVDGVDTPEIRGMCQAEKDMAVRARDFVRATVGAQVQLTSVRLGKYAGRVVADVWVDGRKLSDLLIAENLGRPYHGGRREVWCPLPPTSTSTAPPMSLSSSMVKQPTLKPP